MCAGARAGVAQLNLNWSAVTCAWREPVPGWVDNLNGPTGMVVCAGKGVLRSVLCHDDMVADVVPVDIPINLMITAAWHTAVRRLAPAGTYTGPQPERGMVRVPTGKWTLLSVMRTFLHVRLIQLTRLSKNSRPNMLEGEQGRWEWQSVPHWSRYSPKGHPWIGPSAEWSAGHWCSDSLYNARECV